MLHLNKTYCLSQVLKRPEYFGKFGKIHKVVINNSTSYAGSQVISINAALGFCENRFGSTPCIRREKPSTSLLYLELHRVLVPVPM